MRGRAEAALDAAVADRAIVAGAAASAGWLLLVVLFAWLAPGGDGGTGGSWLMRLSGVAMPLALIWLAVGFARAIAALRAEADALRADLAHLQGGAPLSRTGPGAGFGTEPPHLAADAGPRPGRAAQTDARPRAQPRPAAQAARAARPDPVADTRQTALPLDDSASVSVSAIDLLRALNFPDGPDDHLAIRALQAALADHDTMRLIRAAQDVVTLLAQAGIYMDELAPAPGPASAWRAFAEGVRGPQVAVLAGVSDPNALDVSAHLLRGDEIFRDAAHHFLRQFDRMMARMAPDLDDDFLAALTETRSGRAFVLLAQTSGIFGTTATANPVTANPVTAEDGGA